MRNRLLSLLIGIKYILVSKFRIRSFRIHPTSKIGNGCKIMRGSILSKGVEIGDNVELYRNVMLGNGVKVGDCTSINNSTIVECGKIGSFCSIGVGVIIGLGVHPLTNVTTSTLAQKTFLANGRSHNEEMPKPPVIEDDVWIGSRALIMRGITIHTGAVIGAGAVVTKDVPAYAIVTGVPARVLRYRFDEEVQNKLLKINLWTNYKDKIMIIQELLAANDKFVSLL